MTVEVQYYCDRCEQKFVVDHDTIDLKPSRL